MLAHDDPWALAHPELPAVTSPTLLAMMSPPAAAGAPARGDSDEDDELDDWDDDDDEQQEEECLNWACCSVCAKWRVLPPEYGEPPGETDQWRCSAIANSGMKEKYITCSPGCMESELHGPTLCDLWCTEWQWR